MDANKVSNQFSYIDIKFISLQAGAPHIIQIIVQSHQYICHIVSCVMLTGLLIVLVYFLATVMQLSLFGWTFFSMTILSSLDKLSHRPNFSCLCHLDCCTCNMPSPGNQNKPSKYNKPE